MSKIAVLLLLLTAAVLSFRPADAEEVRNRTHYQILLAGVPLANASFQARRDGNAYAIDAQIATTPVANIIAESMAEMSSTGSVIGGRLEPNRFYFRYKYGKRHRRFETSFAGGKVTESLIEPQPRKKRKHWIPIRPADLLGVTDPVAGLVIPADQDPCRSPIPVYDGETRLDLTLVRKGEQTFKTEGFSGPVVVCSLRYEPKAGYRKGHKDIDYVRKLKNIEIWFAKSAPMQVYAPVYLSVPTSYGPLTIKATHFDG
jgi:hypothetical protein